MQRISRDHATVTAVDARLEPLMRVQPGEPFMLDTEDAGAGYIRDEATLPIPSERPTHTVSPPEVNPLTGPVYIEGAEKGDVIVVSVDAVEPDDQGYSLLQPGEGLLGDSIRHADIGTYLTRILRHEPGPSGTFADGRCHLGDRLSWALEPHIGTLCLAPEREVIAPARLQGPFGGNLDSRDIRAGSKVYLQSYCKGGLLFAGDVHGGQGDGELTGTADETRATVTLSCEVLKRTAIPHVRIERTDRIIGLGCDKPLEKAVRAAVENLMDWVATDYGISEREAMVMFSTCPGFRLHVYQMVDIHGLLYTAGASLERDLLG